MEAAFPAEGANLKLTPRESLHLHRVLRLKSGDACQLFNRQGQRAEAVIETVSERGGAEVRLQKIFSVKRPSLFLRVAQALPQKGKLDELVMRAEELGVGELWVLETERTVVRMKAEARERARARWERIIVEAAKQSGSPSLMQLKGPVAFKKMLEENFIRENPAYLFHPDPSGRAFSEVVAERSGRRGSSSPESVSLFFGPEGGFTEEEVRWAESRGVQKVFLGDSILRMETAFLGVLSALRLLGS